MMQLTNKEMAVIKIDNRKIEVAGGTKLIEAARDNGIFIPSLCYSSSLPHFSSCMVCIVKDIKTGKYIPSCSASVTDGMEIDTTGNDVIKLRRDSLAMLLAEHRAECEAPCRLVCPAGLNIPLFNRLVSSGKIDEARELAKREMGNPTAACRSCPRYCEKACRRKMIDQSVSISSIVIFLSEDKADGDAVKDARLKRGERRFNSTLGKISDDEKQEWIKECPDELKRIKEPASESECAGEAASCMHCDCRASEECSLRTLCNDENIQNPRVKKTAYPIRKLSDTEGRVIFEHAKCIKCGLCVRVTEKQTNEPSLCFKGRGFETILSEPLTFSLDDLPGRDIDKAIEICPTGALTRK